jgi:hypothetical protein
VKPTFLQLPDVWMGRPSDQCSNDQRLSVLPGASTPSMARKPSMCAPAGREFDRLSVERLAA